MSQKKDLIMHELKELSGIVIYLAISFVLISTGKSLILIQLGINDFIHGYVKALVESLALGKIVMLAQNIPLIKNMRSKSILQAASLQAAAMAIIVLFGGELEEKIFAKHVAEAPLKEELLLMIAHLFGLFLVFLTLFVARGLDRTLGKGTLWKLLTESHNPNDSVSNAN
ncbi:MAG: hypothetical protein K2X27_25500 [Candidatus Obscuribacterales bacterium]|nr:hypothetical protein [Candidatus Obscuribacterales bacterium]